MLTLCHKWLNKSNLFLIKAHIKKVATGTIAEETAFMLGIKSSASTNNEV